MFLPTLQARKYLADNPGQAKDSGKNAAVAEHKLCHVKQPANAPGVSNWHGKLSVKSHKGIEAVGDFVCPDWPDHIAQ